MFRLNPSTDVRRQIFFFSAEEKKQGDIWQKEIDEELATLSQNQLAKYEITDDKVHEANQINLLSEQFKQNRI